MKEKKVKKPTYTSLEVVALKEGKKVRLDSEKVMGLTEQFQKGTVIICTKIIIKGAKVLLDMKLGGK